MNTALHASHLNIMKIVFIVSENSEEISANVSLCDVTHRFVFLVTFLQFYEPKNFNR